MINSVQKKLLFFLLVVTNVTVPMEERFLHNITQQGFCEALTNVTMPIEKQLLHSPVNQCMPNYIEIGIDVVNLAYLTYIIYRLADFKKKHCLFGTKLMDRSDKIIEEVNAFIKLVPSVCGSHGHLFMSIGVVGRLRFLLAIEHMIFVSNFVHQDALALLKKSWKEFHPELTIKEKVNIIAITDVSDAEVDITAEPGSDSKCAVCWDNETEKEYVNPCEQKDHIFCKECLMLHFETQKEKFSFVDKQSFLCVLCVKEVPFNDEKFEITAPQSRVTLKSWAQHVGVRHVILYSLSMYTLCLLLHSYLF